jgi:cellulose synthase/poly-beta-1,6-N-acetylglucosamine synthase-like glycosyltransferase
MQFQLLYFYFKKTKSEVKHSKNKTTWPSVTVQLPIYNEKYVINRLLDAIVALEYPKDKLEIQVLDDSTDETSDILKLRIDLLQKLGFDISHIQRTDRNGFKAGALSEGVSSAKGDYIAIFDADFVPNTNFLLETIPHFNDDKIGVVQTRWTHINQNYSLLTRLQAFQLNVHFTVEQKGRENGSCFLQFNGTAGVWRKETIKDAGGWQADTLTEDLDLSYRAQLKGWKIHFLVDTTSPAELPAEINGLKSQQFRWMKGGAETAKKMLPTVWKSDIGIFKKIHATSHLLASSVFVFIFLLGFFSVPLLFLFKYLGFDLGILSIFFTSLITVSIVYYYANVKLAWKDEGKFKMIIKFVLIFPIFIALSMGLSLHNSIAVIQGFFGRKSDFIRTPKYGIQNIKDTLKNRSYFNSEITLPTIFEGLLAFYFTTAFIFGVYLKVDYFLILHATLAFGYGYIFYVSVKK